MLEESVKVCCACLYVCAPAEDAEDDAGYLDVNVSEYKHPPPQLSPMPDGLSSQQVGVCVCVCVCVGILYISCQQRFLHQVLSPIVLWMKYLFHVKI